MKKAFNVYIICWAILLVVFNLIAFLMPNEIIRIREYGENFWIGYILITISFVGQLICAHFAFKQDNLNKFFYNLSLVITSYFTTILSIIVGLLCLAFPFVPIWIITIICLTILGFSIVSIFKAKAATDIVDEVDKKIKEETFFIKSLTVDAEMLIKNSKSSEIKAEAKKIYEAIRYADSISSEALSDIEAQITLKFAIFLKAVETDTIEEAKASAADILVLLNDRNKRCRLLK